MHSVRPERWLDPAGNHRIMTSGLGFGADLAIRGRTRLDRISEVYGCVPRLVSRPR